MKHSFFLILFSLALGFGSLSAQSQLLQSGPMVGYSEMMEVLLWVQTKEVASVKFRYYAEDNAGEKFNTEAAQTKKYEAFTAKLVADKVLPGKKYVYELYINNKRVKRPYPLKFQTQTLWQWRTEPPPFKFIIGSCTYINDTPHDRPGRPYGGEYEIFDTIHQQNANFMIWMGDNTYLREVDWYSRTGILYRYTHTRSVRELQPLFGSMHHYAVWDDHDYGPNNSDRSFRQKHQTLEAFKYFWGNPTFGIDGAPGITTMFQWEDVEFFMLDNRYYRSPNYRRSGERTILGKQQLEWLIDALAASSAPFKFIVSGGQILNPVAKFENHATVAGERERLLNAINQENISGVVFLNGDRHHSELTKLDRFGTYPLHEVTISPLTAGPSTRAEEEPNYLRVADTYVGKRNFAVLAVSGERRNRILNISVRDKTNAELWNYEIKATDLR